MPVLRVILILYLRTVDINIIVIFFQQKISMDKKPKKYSNNSKTVSYYREKSGQKITVSYIIPLII